ncbi:SGNH/GDSL hydrolase family protein [Nocardioides speluncae]|uniref:SGNH/GDSL hydrolase family protein n=1 Tax=Nocardioides speluncae TaxID=2670337 RepID=UPI000D68691A|nr:SGNH/GDSL hydrolase family protein [Nocardioides speluncae]
MSTPAVDYIRFAVLGDSASYGVGDPTPQGWRGWARILAEAIAVEHHVSFCNLAVPGAVVADVRRGQLSEALAHRPVVASLVVGLNDVLRSNWDPEQIRADLLHCAGELARQGAVVMTVRFHDHTRVLGVPGILARPLRRRIAVLNEIYDEVHEQYGTLRLDLASDAAICSRELWAFDRLHPSELGHRWLAHRIGMLLNSEGLAFSAPSLRCTSTPPGPRDKVRTLLTDVAPWLGRRLRGVAPCVAREGLRRTAIRWSFHRRPEPSVR